MLRLAGWLAPAAAIAVVAVAVHRRRTRELLRVSSSSASSTKKNTVGRGGAVPKNKQSVTWCFKLTPWSQQQKYVIGILGQDRDATLRYALNATEGGALEGFFVFRRAWTLAELEEKVLQAPWLPANLKTDWPAVESAFDEVNIWAVQPKARRGGGKGGDGSKGKGEQQRVAQEQCVSDRSGPVVFHAARDFEWEELRARYAPALAANPQATNPDASSSSGGGAVASAGATSKEAIAPVAVAAAAASAMQHQISGWERHFVGGH